MVGLYAICAHSCDQDCEDCKFGCNLCTIMRVEL